VPSDLPLAEASRSLASGQAPDEPAGNFESLADQAYRILERLLVVLELAPGSVVTEQMLATRTGMGRTPVREAVQRLAREGLMEIRPRSGIAIAPLDPRDFPLVLAARRGVEMVLARSAARRASADDRGRLRRAETAMHNSVVHDDTPGFLDADKAVDTIMASASGNPYAARLAAPLQTHSRRFWYRLKRPGDLRTSMERHVEIIEAVVAGDPDRAADAADRLIDHLSGIAGD